MRFCAQFAFQGFNMRAALSLGERVSRSGAFTSRSGTGEGSVRSCAMRNVRMPVCLNAE
jgi:hypothetical protein